MNPEEHLFSVVIGVKYRSNYAFADKLGAITDEILYSENSFFKPEVFPQAVAEVQERILFNPRTNDHLRIGPQAVILEVFDYSGTNDFLKAAIEAFKKDIIDGVIKKHRITQVIRVGFIKRYLIKDTSVATGFIHSLLGEDISNINDIDLKYSRKKPILKSYVTSDVNDYYNVIYNFIKRADEDKLFVSVDFQRYFDPLMNYIDAFDYNNFISEADSHNSKFMPEQLSNVFKVAV